MLALPSKPYIHDTWESGIEEPKAEDTNQLTPVGGGFNHNDHKLTNWGKKANKNITKKRKKEQKIRFYRVLTF